MKVDSLNLGGHVIENRQWEFLWNAQKSIEEASTLGSHVRAPKRVVQLVARLAATLAPMLGLPPILGLPSVLKIRLAPALAPALALALALALARAAQLAASLAELAPTLGLAPAAQQAVGLASRPRISALLSAPRPQATRAPQPSRGHSCTSSRAPSSRAARGGDAAQVTLSLTVPSIGQGAIGQWVSPPIPVATYPAETS